MAGIEVLNPGEWELDRTFNDRDGKPIRGLLPNCTIGSYIIEREDDDTTTSPACNTCEFSGDLDAVFNPDEGLLFEPGAPECFKTAAALVLSSTPTGETAVDSIRVNRPDTARIIDTYFSNATSAHL